MTAAAAVKVQATWLVARGLNPAVPCGYRILIDAPVPKNAADMCTSAAANKAKVWHYIPRCYSTGFLLLNTMM